MILRAQQVAEGSLQGGFTSRRLQMTGTTFWYTNARDNTGRVCGTASQFD